jgi:hypothetical protein
LQAARGKLTTSGARPLFSYHARKKNGEDMLKGSD